MIQLVKDRIADRMPDFVQLGIEMHYDTEVNDENATEVADALLDADIYLAMIAPGAHSHFAYSGISSLDPDERKAADELDNNAMVHMHLNRQGYNDGIILGGPGKYDIDHGARVNGMNIALTGLIQDAGCERWKGHDVQTRAYDNSEQGIDRVIQSILSWEACEKAARELDTDRLLDYLEKRETAKAEDIMRDAVVSAQLAFNKMYKE